MSKLVKIPAQHYGIAVKAGLLDNHSGIHKFGQNGTIDTNTDPEDVWTYGGLYDDHFMAAAATLYISSDVEGDTAIGITVEYLDADWNIATVSGVTHAVDGRTFISLAVTGIRVYRAYVTTGTAPSGNIYVSEDNTDAGGNGIPDTTTDIKAIISIGDNQTLMCVYTIPLGYTGYLVDIKANMISNVASSRSTLSLCARPPGGVFTVKDRFVITPSQSYNSDDSGIPSDFAEKTDIVMRVDTVSHNATNVTGNFDIIFIRTNALDTAGS